jgi:S-adenosylmethionine hydrolase
MVMMFNKIRCLFLCIGCCVAHAIQPIALMTDFGLIDGAVGAMKGVILTVDSSIVIQDITHNITPFNVLEGAYRLEQAAPYYPKGTIFIGVVDPGVGTQRASIVVKFKNGDFFIGPDNGLCTLMVKRYGVETIRLIDEKYNRLHHHNRYEDTFYGRDVYAYTGAKLSAGTISFKEVGPVTQHLHGLSLPQPMVKPDVITGRVILLDGVYGNLWTNIHDNAQFFKLNQPIKLKIYHRQKLLYTSNVAFKKTFGHVSLGQPLMYVNSLGYVAVALNQDNFSKRYHVSTNDTIIVHKIPL